MEQVFLNMELINIKNKCFDSRCGIAGEKETFQTTEPMKVRLFYGKITVSVCSACSVLMVTWSSSRLSYNRLTTLTSRHNNPPIKSTHTSKE